MMPGRVLVRFLGKLLLGLLIYAAIIYFLITETGADFVQILIAGLILGYALVLYGIISYRHMHNNQRRIFFRIGNRIRKRKVEQITGG